jgi:hypothetical protein
MRFLSNSSMLLEFDEIDLRAIMEESEATPFTTRQVLDRLVATYNANFENDIIDALKDLEEV